MLGNLHEIIIYARDMDGLAKFYRDKVGLPVAWPEGQNDYSKEHWVQFGNGGATLALHSGGVETSGLAPRFGFEVTDIGAERDRLLAGGVRCGDIREAIPGLFVVDCLDPENNCFYLEEDKTGQ
jgi:predicted enzyme related to lactoylglutathione lyase